MHHDVIAIGGSAGGLDALFRSASWAYGPRVIGVVLSGYQDCGTAGMMSIKARGGIAVVQSPESALAWEMPRSVIDRVEVDHVVHPLELPGLLVRLVSQPVTREVRTPSETVQQLDGMKPGVPAELVCPACQGVLTETKTGEFTYFRCHVGHAFSLKSLAAQQGEEVERALWAAVRSLEESAALSHRLAGAERDNKMSRRFADRAATLIRHADRIREILLHGEGSDIPEPSQS